MEEVSNILINSSPNLSGLFHLKMNTYTILNSYYLKIFDRVSAGIDKASQFKEKAVQLSYESGNLIKESSSKAYMYLAIADKNKIFYKLINSIDLVFLIEFLNGLKLESKSNPKQLLAISGLIKLLMYSNRQKLNRNVVDDFKEDDEVKHALNKIPLKDILSYAHTVVIFFTSSI